MRTYDEIVRDINAATDERDKIETQLAAKNVELRALREELSERCVRLREENGGITAPASDTAGPTHVLTARFIS